MAKRNEIIYDIREGLREFSDDTETDDRHLLYLLNIKRAKYLRQDLNNFQKTVDTSIQQSFCIGLEEVSADECSADINCDTILRTKMVVPKAIELHTKPAITKIKPTNRISASFNFITKDKAPYIKHSSYGNSIYAFLDVDNYVYFISGSDTHKLIDCISITGIFENPMDLTNYSNCCDCAPEEATVCYNEEEDEYPLQPHYVDVIKGEILNDLLRLKQVKEDKVNDANDTQLQ